MTPGDRGHDGRYRLTRRRLLHGVGVSAIVGKLGFGSLVPPRPGAIAASARGRWLGSPAPRERGLAGRARLVIGTEAAIEGLDPRDATTLATARVQHNIFEGLLRHDPGSANLRPCLAIAVPTRANGGISADGCRYTFRLRRSVRFHDGSAFDAFAVEASWRRLFDAAATGYRPSRWRHAIPPITAIDVIDRWTVSLTLARPDPAALELVGVYGGKIVSPFAIRGRAEIEARSASGTGPFRLARWDRRGVVLERNPDYWGQAPGLSRLDFRPISDERQRVRALLQGRVDLIVAVPPRAIPRILARSDLTYAQGPSLGAWAVELVTTSGAFGNWAVRHAANYAIDARAIAAEVMRGSATPSTQLVTAADWCFDSTFVGYPFDPAIAHDLLRESGLGAGFETTMLVPRRDPRVRAEGEIVELVARDLRAVGIDPAIRHVDLHGYVTLWLQERDGPNGAMPPADGRRTSLVPEFPRPARASASSIGQQPERTGTAPPLTDDDDGRRQYRQAWRAMTEAAPRILIVDDLQPVAFKSWVRGYVTNPDYLIDFAALWPAGRQAI